MLNQQREQEIIELCRELVQCRSYSGEEGDVADRLQQAFVSLGYDAFWRDRYGNMIGCIRGNRPGKRLLFDGHLDTVPVVDAAQWRHAPFGAEVEAGRIYGRGTSDMKGAVSAMTAAAAYFAADSRRNFPGEIYVAGVVHEECFEGVSAREISRQIQPDYVVIGEASELNLKRGQRGRAEIVVETYGRPAHSANPQWGVNAVYLMAELVRRIRQLTPPAHNVMGAGIMELTDIKSSPYPGASVVPDYCRATYDRRLLVGETPASVLKPLQELLAAMERENPECKASVGFAAGKERCYTGAEIEGDRFFPGWLYEKEEPFIAAAWEGLLRAGLTPELTQYSFCTNGSHYAGEAGIPTIGFGPSRENLAHTIDEYIEIDQLLQAAAAYYGILAAVLR